MSDRIDEILTAKNQMPWFVKSMEPTAIVTPQLMMSAARVMSGDEDVVQGECTSFDIFHTQGMTYVPVGALGQEELDKNPVEGNKMYDIRFVPSTWTKRVAVLTPDVFLMVRVSLPHNNRIRDVVKAWLKRAGIASSFDPSTNDMLINNKKFLGVVTTENPAGYICEFGMMTMHKDQAVFDACLPELFSKNARGYELSGLLDEVTLDLERTIGDLYEVERGAHI